MLAGRFSSVLSAVIPSAFVSESPGNTALRGADVEWPVAGEERTKVGVFLTPTWSKHVNRD